MIKNKKMLSVLLFGLVLILFFVSIFFLFLFTRYPLYYKSSIQTYCDDYNLNPGLVASIINSESSFNPNAVSNKGAIGLMQIMPTTANWICKKNNIKFENIDSLYNPDTNIKIGCLYLKYLIDKFDNLDNALYAYNAGEGTVKTWLLNKNYSIDGKTLNNIPYTETKNYTQKIYGNLKVYKYLI